MAKSMVTNVTLIDLFHKMESGGIRTPNFNRGFVWNKSLVKSLFESIYLGYPIGMILAVQGDFDDFIPSSKEQSHFPETVEDIYFNNSSTLWIIDGSQRLAALYGVLKGRSLDISLHYDLTEKEFVYKPKAKNKNSTIRMSDLFDYKAFMDFQDNLFSSESHKELLKEVNNLHSKFQNYQVAMQVVADIDSNEVIDVFMRLNMSGRSLKKDEIEKAKSNKKPNKSSQ
ncbi:MAG: hypothetical protein Sw1PiTSA_41000 [Shewanella algae]|uniref:DUF262 domain-containing protein n=1 Tax=Shewanella algae TaxID=38313 RepID=UPI001AADD40B|nr:DUF262 domain-containing protein [Shewanella algae]MBO2623639.1 DUF262 domain-containing protein [Shewanella algae]